MWLPRRRLLAAGAVAMLPGLASGQLATVGAGGKGGGSSPPPGYTGPLDLTATQAVVAYGQRALSAAMLGQPVYTIRRDSDDATQSFSSDAVTGAVDAAAISAFIGGGNGFVTSWRDQSGSSNHATQATASDQPQWLAAALNTFPALVAAAVSTALVTGSAISFPNGQVTFFIVSEYGCEFFATDGTAYVDSDGAQNAYIDMYDGTNEAGGDYSNMLPDDVFALFDAAWEFGSANYKRNGVDLTQQGSFDTGGAVGPFSAPGQILMSNATPGDNQSVVELIVYNTLLSDGDRTAIRQNIATYYGITLS